MKGSIWVIRATLRAALWKSTAADLPVSVRTVLAFVALAMASETARQYLAIEGAAGFSLYGVNSIIAAMAVFVAVALLFVSRDRTRVVAQLAALTVLSEWLVIAAGRLPFQFHIFMPGVWTGADRVIFACLVVMVWWIGAVASILRAAGIGPYQSPVFRAFWLCVVAGLAVVALPAFPTFVGSDFRLSSYNVWEWGYARLFKPADEDAPSIDLASVELAQPPLLEAEVKRLLPDRKGRTDVYAIGVAGWSGQDVFIKELNGGLVALDRSLGLDRGVIRLANHRDTLQTLPVANRTNFSAAVHAVAGVMNKDEDVLVVFITSHGGPTGVGLQLGNVLNAVLGPQHVAAVLDREGIQNRVVIVSACYSGVFIKPLASENSIVLTAADENSPSFGCSNEREWTYFGDAFFNQSLAEGVSLEKAFEDAKLKVSEWEARDDISPSSPQGHFGASISATLAARLKPGNSARASAEER
ncbi:C13 family peptidase [Bradyrhizobium sp. CB1650]|uniref:C13 family peptidase n=1 Tax=Bradyrhizobium sp. CB1650 TaxID=3039153 RepID=UPI0024355C51|nr:C13 family peptidase [Bradyrhizobium sp. CB1650]WGD49916.1 C13 family peptidase [Bradyrhizobium sp. CB1650]